MTWYRVGPAGIPGSLKTDMDAVLNKKFGTSTTYAPNTWPDNVNLLGPLPEKTASGAIAHIDDGADAVPLKNWLVTLPASLDGYTEVNGVRTGKNIVNVTFSDFNASNIISNAFSLKAGTYTLSLNYIGTPTWGIYLRDGSAINSPVLFSKYNDTSLTFTLSEDKETLCFTMYYANGILSSEVSDVQLEVGSTATAYEAYEAPTTYTASLGRTIYGGTADIVTGEGEDENGNAFTFTPIQADTELGVNNFWADEGDSDVTYRADISLALQAINGGRGLMGMMMQRPEEEQLTEEDPEEVPEEEAETNER